MASTIATLNTAAYASSTNPLAAQHFWDLSPSSQLAILGRRRSQLYAMTMAGMGLKSRVVTDKVFKTLQEHPMIKDILIKGYDVSAAGDTAITLTLANLKLTDITGTITDPRTILRVGDRLHVHSFQDNQTAAQGTVAVSGEIMEVASLPNPTYFVVTRNIGSTSTAANVTAGSNSALHAKIQGAAMSERSRSRQNLTHSLLSIENYIQNFQEVFETTDDLEATLLVGGSTFAREQRQKLDAIMADINEALIWGRKGLSLSSGDPTYSTQGWASMLLGDTTTYAAYSATTDLVTGDGTSRIWNVGNPESLTPRNLLEFLGRLYEEGSDNKVMACGAGFFNKHILSMEGYFTIDLGIADPFSPSWNISAIRYRTTPLPVIVDDTFNGPKYNDALVLDMEHTGIARFGTGDLHVWTGQGGDGLQDNDSHVKKNAYEAQLGSDMDYRIAGAYIIGLKNDDATYGGLYQTVGTRAPSTI